MKIILETNRASLCFLNYHRLIEKAPCIVYGGIFSPKVFSSSSLPPWEVGTWKMNKRERRDLPMSRLTPFCLSKGHISAGPPLRLFTVHIPPVGQENGLQTTAGPVVGHTHLQTRTPTLSCPPTRARRTTPCAWLSIEKDECEYRTRLLCDFSLHLILMHRALIQAFDPAALHFNGLICFRVFSSAIFPFAQPNRKTITSFFFL